MNGNLVFNTYPTTAATTTTIPITNFTFSYPNEVWQQIEGSQMRTNGWWVESMDAMHKFQYAWLPQREQRWGCLNQCMFRTWEYAPVEEFMEAEPENYVKWARRLSEDESYLQAQLEAQDRLFENQRVRGLWSHRSNVPMYEDFAYTYTTNTSRIYYTGADGTHQYVDRPLRDIDEPLPLLNHAVKKKTDFEIAIERSKKLLLTWLTKDEYKAYIKNEAIELQSHKNADIVYIVKMHRRVEIVKKSENRILAQACIIVPDPGIVENDQFLTKLLLIKNDEDRFLKTANISRQNNGGKLEELPIELRME